MPKREPADVRFWRKVVKTDTCWLWVAGKNSDGYGTFWDGLRQTRAHRWAYEAVKGAIPNDLHLDHLCRVRHCVNPDHLDPVTNAENARRGEAGLHMQAKAEQRTHCPHGHPWTAENTRLYRGARHCKTCRRGWKREQRALALATPTTPSPSDGDDVTTEGGPR